MHYSLQRKLDAPDLAGKEIPTYLILSLLRCCSSACDREDGFELPPPAGGFRRPGSFDLAGDMEDMRGMADEQMEEQASLSMA